MFLGHFAVAYGAKRFAPHTSLGMLFLGVQLPDLIWPALVLLGLERVEIAPGDTAATPFRFVSYPITHSLIADLGWGLILAGVYYGLRHYKPGAIALAVGVLSHWVLDVITHRPDMPVLFSGPKVGLALWNAPIATLIVEVAMLATGVALYARATRPADGVGRYATWGLVGLLVVLFLASAASPPPPSVAAVVWTGLFSGWLMVAWAYWADAHRQPAAAGS